MKPVKRRGNRRYYQHHEVLLIRRIRELLYEQGFTISGARNRLDSRGGEVEDKPEPPMPREIRVPQGVNGVDVAAIKRELRAGPRPSAGLESRYLGCSAAW